MIMARRVKATGVEVSDAATAAFRAQAREAGVAAIAALLQLASGAESESVKLAAIKELLDRGFGRVAASESAAGTIGYVVVDDGYGH